MPDLDGELEAVFAQLEDVLVAIGSPPLEGDEWEPPPELSYDRAARPIGRLAAAVQRAGRLAGRVFASDGRYEHLALRVVTVACADLAAMADAVEQLAACRQPGGDEVIGAHVTEAEHARRNVADRGDVVAQWVRLHRLLDPPVDTDLLVGCLGDGMSDVRLTPTAEAAYQRTVTRLIAEWHDNDPIARYLY